MPHWLRPLAAVALGVLMLNAPAAQAGELSDPTGSVILVVGGAITDPLTRRCPITRTRSNRRSSIAANSSRASSRVWNGLLPPG